MRRHPCRESPIRGTVLTSGIPTLQSCVRSGFSVLAAQSLQCYPASAAPSSKWHIRGPSSAVLIVRTLPYAARGYCNATEAVNRYLQVLFVSANPHGQHCCRVEEFASSHASHPAFGKELST